MASFDPGGTERQMTELIRRLDRSRWTVHVATFRPRGAWFERVAEVAESVATFPVGSFKSPRSLVHAWRFARWCREQRIAVVHTAEIYSNIFGLPAAALAGVPVRVANRREINPDKSSAHIALQRAAYGCAHVVVANSHAAAARLMAEHVPAQRIAVVSNGLDCDRYRSRPVRLPLRRIVMVANLRTEKAHDVLIEATALLLRTYPDVRVTCVGDGPERDRLMALAHDRGVSHAVAFPGHADDIPAVLAANDVFVLSSRSEAFPNAVLEAMAAGLPVVASNVGGIPEIVDDGRTGLLMPPDDPRALADRLMQLLSSPALAALLGAAARADVRARYSFDRMVHGFEQLYLTQLARRARLKPRAPERDWERQALAER